MVDKFTYRTLAGEHKKLLSFSKPIEFDPIKQHRHFCPWILSTGKSAPGWLQTLSALEENKELSNVCSSSLVEVMNYSIGHLTAFLLINLKTLLTPNILKILDLQWLLRTRTCMQCNFALLSLGASSFGYYIFDCVGWWPCWVCEDIIHISWQKESQNLWWELLNYYS